MLLRTKISSDSDNLDLLHQEYNWIPSSENVRRSEETQAKQMLDMIPVQKYYASFRDYILDIIFGANVMMNTNGQLLAKETYFKQEYKLLLNQYPYKVSPQTKHYILWYIGEKPTDEQITKDIDSEIGEWKNYQQTQFVWYENPKIHREVYHVQVFIYQTLPILSES
jgi:hypothetical protein